MTVEALKFKAGKFVHGVVLYRDRQTKQNRPKIDYGRWSDAFCELEMVRTAEREGWGRSLRRHVDARVWTDTLDPNRKAYRSPLEYMPKDQRWIEHEREKARTEREAQEWQRQQPIPHRLKRQQLEMRVAAPDFAKMLSDTPNRDLHGINSAQQEAIKQAKKDAAE